MEFIVIGTNHRYSPLALRERLYFPKNGLRNAYLIFREKASVKEAVILSTCNRIEAYVASCDPAVAINDTLDFISRYHELGRERFAPYFYRYENKEAFRHLLRVACGLDSLILGEGQILEQLRPAFSTGENVTFTGAYLKGLFYYAEACAFSVRRESGLSATGASIGSISADFIRQKFGGLRGLKILIVGTGKVTHQVLGCLTKDRPEIIFIANKTFKKAEILAEQIGAEAVRFNDLSRLLRQADVVLTATACPHFVIKKEDIGETCPGKLLIIDLGFPRNVDPQISRIKNVEVFHAEDLLPVINANNRRLGREVDTAQEIIEGELEGIWEKVTNLGQERARLL